jgi:hypothetical protein
MSLESIPWPVYVVVGLVLLLGVGLSIEAFVSKRRGQPPLPARQRPRFVRTMARMTMRLRRKRPDDEESKEQE